MTEPRLDPAGFYELDLSRGTVRTRSGDRVVVLTDEVARALLTMARDTAALRELGATMAAEAARHLDDAAGAPPEQVLGEAAAALGVFGWGKLGLERWGDALVATLDEAPAQASEALAALLGGFFSRLTGHEVACVAASDGKYVMVHPTVADAVRSWASAGAEVPAIVAKLGRPA